MSVLTTFLRRSKTLPKSTVRSGTRDAEVVGLVDLVQHVGDAQDGLGGDAGVVEAAAADGVLLDHGGAHPELGGADGGDVAARSRADDDAVVGALRHGREEASSQAADARFAQRRPRGGVAGDAVHRAAGERRGAAQEQPAHRRAVRVEARRAAGTRPGRARRSRRRRRRRRGSRCAARGRRGRARAGRGSASRKPGAKRSICSSTRSTGARSRRPVGVVRAVGVGPRGVLALGRAASGRRAICWPTQQERPLVQAGARRRQRLEHLALAAADVHRAGLARLGRLPRDRAGQRPVQLQRRGPGTERAQLARVPAAQRVAASRSSAAGTDVGHHDAAPGTCSAPATSTPVTRPRSACIRVTGAPVRTVPPSDRRCPISASASRPRRPRGSASPPRGPSGSGAPRRSRCPALAGGASPCIAEPYSHARVPSPPNSRPRAPRRASAAAARSPACP